MPDPRPKKLTHAELAARIRKLNYEAEQENWSPRTRALHFALTLGRLLSPLHLFEDIVSEMTPEAIAERKADPEYQRFLRERPGTVTPEQLRQAANTVGGAAGEFAERLAARDPGALGAVAAVAAPVAASAIYPRTPAGRLASLNRARRVASVERLATERALPDPQLPREGLDRPTFQRRAGQRPPSALPDDYAILTAENPEGLPLSPEENARLTAKLKADIKVLGYEPRPTRGAYRDSQTGELLHENNFIVRGIPRDLAMKLMQRYRQNSYPDSRGMVDVRSGEITPISRVKEISGDDVPFTELPNGKRVRMIYGEQPISEIAQQYRQRYGIENQPLERVSAVDDARGKEMSDIYDSLKSDPTNPEVIEAYQQFAAEVEQQAAMLKEQGFSWEFVDRDPYKTSKEMLQDLHQNRHIKVYRTQGSQGHPLLTNAQNDLFRAIHEILGHGIADNSFGKIGEENAFRAHATLFSPRAQRVLATETRGQNSWFNFSEANRGKPNPQRSFAPQKAALWPETHLGEYHQMPISPEPSPKYSAVRESMRRIDEAGAVDPYISNVVLPEGAPEVLGPSLRRVLRVETERGTGPYQAMELRREGKEAIQVARQALPRGVPAKSIGKGIEGHQPTPFAENVWDRFSSADVFGFPSREHYERWFTPHERAILQREGFNLNEYDVPTEAISMETPTQLAFDPDAASLIRQGPPGLLHLFDPQKGVPNVSALERLHGRPESGFALREVAPGTYLHVPQEPIVGRGDIPGPARESMFRRQLDEARRATHNPLLLDDVRRGLDMQYNLWYNADPVYKMYLDVLGDPALARRMFDEFVNYNKPTSIQTEPVRNVRNASYQYYRSGNPQTPVFAEGFRPLYRQQMLDKLAQLEEQGGHFLLSQGPKLEPFGTNIGGNWLPLTADVHNIRRAADYGFEFGKTGRRAWDQAFRERAHELVGEGILPEVPGRDPTASLQSTTWAGGGGPIAEGGTGIYGLQRARPQWWQIVEDAIGRTAQHTGLDPQEVMRLFVRKGIPLF